MYGLDYIDIIKQRNNGKIPIDQLWNLNTDRQLWYDIPGFNGYQISNAYHVRSFKYKNKYPFGVLIMPDKNNNFELSDNDNMRIKISLQEIIDKSIYKGAIEYPTYYINQISRNKRLGINQDPILTAQKKGLVRKSVPVNKQENTAMARFTVTNNPRPLL